MKKLFAFMALFAGLILPCLAQAQVRLSLSDQKRFDSYYSRWQSYRQTNNQSQVRSMEGRMQDVYRHYGIPANTPYGNVASGGSRTWGSGTWNGNRTPDRDPDRDRDDDRDGHHDNGRHRGWYKHHHDHDKDHDREDQDHDHDNH
ncbi:MAG TPA: hypothetical protein VGV15_00515 [Terriglobales bacterium]|nr:hypothetical protein [Terriglobales bacterium]